MPRIVRLQAPPRGRATNERTAPSEPARQQAAIAAAFGGTERPIAGPTPRGIVTARIAPDIAYRLLLSREVSGQSSQEIIAEALDAYLGSKRALEALVKASPPEVPGRRTRNGRFL